MPTGPLVRLPPHNLRGEAAEWIDAKLEEEVKRIQKIDPDMVATLRDNVAAIGLLDMFQN